METLPEDPQLEEESNDESEDGQNGGENEAEEKLSLDEINKTLGKDFKDVKTALKSLKDTQSYVGKKLEAVKDPTIEEKLENLERDLTITNFYREHPEYDKPEIRDLIKELGDNPNEVVEKEFFKKVYEKVSAYEKTQESKSVLHHNSSRLGKATTKIGEANDARQRADSEAVKGNISEAKQAQAEAEAKAVESVIESFE